MDVDCKFTIRPERVSDMFCNPPARRVCRAGAWKAGRCRRWTHFPSTVVTNVPCNRMRGCCCVQVDCRTYSEARRTPAIRAAELHPSLYPSVAPIACSPRFPPSELPNCDPAVFPAIRADSAQSACSRQRNCRIALEQAFPACEAQLLQSAQPPANNKNNTKKLLTLQANKS